MSAAGAAAEDSVATLSPVERVRELGRREREAISAGDWDALDETLEAQKTLWQELFAAAQREDDSEECREAAEALVVLYQVRRHNHALIEQSFAEMRRRLATAHAGSGARSAYVRASRRAA